MAIKKLTQANGDDILVARAEFNANGETLVGGQASETTLGGIKASPKTDEDTQEVKIDPKTGKLYVKPGSEGTVSGITYEVISTK